MVPIMLFARAALFISLQAVFALFFFIAGSATAWEDGANWWPITVAIADFICLVLLIRLFKAEGKRYWYFIS